MSRSHNASFTRVYLFIILRTFCTRSFHLCIFHSYLLHFIRLCVFHFNSVTGSLSFIVFFHSHFTVFQTPFHALMFRVFHEIILLNTFHKYRYCSGMAILDHRAKQAQCWKYWSDGWFIGRRTICWGKASCPLHYAFASIVWHDRKRSYEIELFPRPTWTEWTSTVSSCLIMSTTFSTCSRHD